MAAVFHKEFPMFRNPMTNHLLTLAVTLGGLFGGLCHAQAGEAVRYSVDGEPYEGWYEPAAAAVESGSARGLILILHDWDGLTEYEVQRAGMLAGEGFDVFAADLFGAGIRPTENRDKRQHTGELYKDREKMRRLMRAALDAAEQQGADPSTAVAMGYCFGGAAVLELARSGIDLQGFASFHGGLSTPAGQGYAETRGMVLVYHGSADTAITLQDFAALGEQLESAGVPHEMTSYGGAPHAFTVFGSSRYVERADSQSWASFHAFLDENLPR